MSIRCRNPNCAVSHENPFLCCPNCGTQLLEVRVFPPALLEFRGDGWQKFYMASHEGVVLDNITAANFTADGLQVCPGSGNRPFVIPRLKLYNMLCEAQRELLEA